MKYRRLSIEELNIFEKEFIDFLVVNGIDADSWEVMKTEEVDKADGIVDAFSDMIMETVLRKTQYLAFHGTNNVRAFHCLQDQMVMVSVVGKEDFGDQSWNELLTSGKLECFHSSKPYEVGREEDMFQLIESGCEISDGELFKQLSLLMASTQG